MTLTYDQIIERMEEIEQALADRATEYEDASRDFTKYQREYELEIAKASLASHAATETQKKNEARDKVAQLEIYKLFLEAEAKHEGVRIAMKVLEQRAMILMSRLKSETRETGPSPQWSGSAAA